MKVPIFIGLMSFCATSLGQASKKIISKPIIDSAAVNHWPSLTPERAISSDGRYFMYGIENKPMGSRTLVVKSTEGSWQREFTGVSTGVFSGNNKEFIFQDGDTLFFLSLDGNDLNRITGVDSYLQPPGGKGRWLVYQLKNTDQELLIRDLLSNHELHFKNVTGYLIDEGVTKILLKTNDGLKWANISDGRVSDIWSQKQYPGSVITSYTFDKKGDQICFLTTEQKGSVPVNTIWYYREGMGKAIVKVNDQSEGIERNLKVAATMPAEFSGNGSFIFFGLTSNVQIQRPSPDAISVDVWSWRDSLLQSEQLDQIEEGLPVVYTAVVSCADRGQVVRLERENEKIAGKQEYGDYVVVRRNNNPGDRFWLDCPDSNWLVSVKDGSRAALHTKGYSECHFSPDGQYLVYYDLRQQGVFFSYDLKTGRVQTISSGVPDHLLAANNDFLLPQADDSVTVPVGLVGWELSDTSLLVYDNYDIWRLSLTASKAPVNITHGYGRGHHIKLRAADEQDPDGRLCQRGDSLLLIAFNTQTKYNGFYKVSLSGTNDPLLLSMGPWSGWHMPYETSENPNDFNNTGRGGMVPLKAANTGSWVILSSTATEAPNYFVTHDFKTYRPLTDQAPQKNYNWLTTELVNWIQPDGIKTQGVLYKPEDFDPRKKYPVLIHYYQQFSHRLYEYPQPEYTNSAHINIPWFVSRGYLVFTPDIYYRRPENTESAYVTVESAAKMLSGLPYVDSNMMGIAGHSWGGAETNYVVTHSHLFAAALSGAAGHNGVDLISNSLAILPFWGNSLKRYEDNIGSTLWQRPDLWIKNSPVFQADQVTTPFLIFYNKSDNDWLRALEFFIALRRLEKPVWMLQYDHGGHSVDGKDAADFTIRITQFFDHYLKGAPMPIWMNRGIPARLKGIETGYQIDDSDAKPQL